MVIMCTAKTSQEAEIEFRQLGANHILHKPFKPLQLADFLSKLS
jgi:DNA-binding response OmpR family regulator